MAGLSDLGAGGKLAVPSLGSAIGGSTNKDLMAAARTALSGNWGMAILGCVLFFLLISSFFVFLFSVTVFAGASTASGAEDFVGTVDGMSPLFSLVQFLISGAVSVGFAGFFLGIAQEGEAQLDRLFIGFRRFWKSLGVYFFSSLLVFLWSLLLVIPGIIAAFRYAMVYFIIADDEDCGPWEALGRSRDMMRGCKWKFFCLNLRFIGWILLCSILPVGYLWLVPYMKTSFAKFYQDVS